MNYFALDPEVAGELGAGSVVNRSTYPPEVSRVECAFHDWSGDDLVTAFPVFLVTGGLAEALAQSALSGFEIRDATSTLADEGGEDDIGLVPRASLVVSEAALTVLRTRKLELCEVTAYQP
ncbi:hypothetical protein [Actinokineospora inagensis]|uniref:hypothetical protein n=1 Tax=Actinokineospora inagensis TaxID=103730 RepID=UPI00041B443E|nr:hypothetical protein [Actinokineospora inagensis]